MSLYVKLQTEILTDPKILMAGPEGFTMWAKGLCYALQHLTDGFIPQESLQILGIGLKKPEQIAKKLCELGLWKKVDGGYTVGLDKWAKYQRTSEEVELKKAQNRERQQRYRDSLQSGDKRVSNDERNALLTLPDNRSQITDNNNNPLTPKGESWHCLPVEFHEPAKVWSEYRRESNIKAWKEVTWKSQPKAFDNDASRFARAVEYTISKGWQGLQEPKDVPLKVVGGGREIDEGAELAEAFK